MLFKVIFRIFSFFIDDAHYNLIVKLLNDRFGIQTRGGCSCAGTYGHYLLHVDIQTSKAIEHQIIEGCLIDRPGWVRMSIHPTITNDEVAFICESIQLTAQNFKTWKEDYEYQASTNEFVHKSGVKIEEELVKKWFS